MASTVQSDHEPRVLDRARLSRFLDNLEESKRPISLKMVTPGGDTDGWEWLPRPARESPAGLALIECEDGPQLQAAVAPPFPISASSEHDDLSALRAHIAKPVTVGVILLRLGYYAIGVANDGALWSQRAGRDTCGASIVPAGNRRAGSSAIARSGYASFLTRRAKWRELVSHRRPGLSTGLRWAAIGRCWPDS